MRFTQLKQQSRSNQLRYANLPNGKTSWSVISTAIRRLVFPKAVIPKALLGTIMISVTADKAVVSNGAKQDVRKVQLHLTFNKQKLKLSNVETGLHPFQKLTSS